ncbi:5-(carboxyamino)imidazole ribonucleotide synthase [Halomarina rubra]|uniref:N5-carboxyaminoimidazole ribonucleotide synthase n=1 Tax=Halomarina rubra TaxID=2071873 RepID=A0ABD6AQX2_9EURY
MNLRSPGPTVGVVGGGQLARMLGEAAGPLGVQVVALDPTPDPPAAPVVADTVAAAFDDEAAITALAEGVDVLTYEIELADADALERVREETDTPVHPSPETLRRTQDKLLEKEWLAGADIPVPDFVAVDDETDLRAAGEALGWPVMLKARQGGYDGRGNLPVESPEECEVALDELGGTDEHGALAEAMVPFERELSVIGVRGADGETATYPVTETVHEEEILRESVQPARTSDAVAERAREVATDVLDAMDGRGVFGIELFQVGEDVLVNEIAPRPHNSGHWTIEGAHCSQFEQHARSVLGWPLGATERRDVSVTTNLLGDVDDPEPAELSGVESVLSAPDAHLHWYGKREVRPLRKMGHVTVVGEERETTLDRAREVRDAVTFR